MNKDSVKTLTFMEDRLDGGIGRVIVNLSNTMSRYGVKVDLLIKNLHGQYVKKLDQRVRVIKIPTYHRYTGVLYVARYLWSTPTAALIVPSERLAAIALAARKCSFQRPKVFASDIPIVSTDCPYGPSEILDKGRYGTLVPVADVNALAEAIEQALQAEKRPKIPQKAKHRFTAEASMEQYLALCDIHIPSSDNSNFLGEPI